MTIFSKLEMGRMMNMFRNSWNIGLMCRPHILLSNFQLPLWMFSKTCLFYFDYLTSVRLISNWNILAHSAIDIISTKVLSTLKHGSVWCLRMWLVTCLPCRLLIGFYWRGQARIPRPKYVFKVICCLYTWFII